MKRCPHCGEDSYSSTGDSKWVCPNCGADISHINAEMPSYEGERKELVKLRPKGLGALMDRMRR